MFDWNWNNSEKNIENIVPLILFISPFLLVIMQPTTNVDNEKCSVKIIQILQHVFLYISFSQHMTRSETCIYNYFVSSFNAFLCACDCWWKYLLLCVNDSPYVSHTLACLWAILCKAACTEQQLRWHNTHTESMRISGKVYQEESLNTWQPVSYSGEGFKDK